MSSDVTDIVEDGGFCIYYLMLVVVLMYMLLPSMLYYMNSYMICLIDLRPSGGCFGGEVGVLSLLKKSPIAPCPAEMDMGVMIVGMMRGRGDEHRVGRNGFDYGQCELLYSAFHCA